MSLASEQDGWLPSASPTVATLGMFIIDTFLFQDELTGDSLGDRGLGEQIGGGGTYFALGARMWLPCDQVMMTVDRGEDFSTGSQTSLDSYIPASQSGRHSHALWRFRQRQGRTTRAVNIYRGQLRGFEYLTPKIRLDPVDLVDEETYIRLPRFIHCICSPQRALEIVSQVDQLHSRWSRNGVRPLMVWEPIPDSAVLSNLPETIKAACKMSVVSPNHEEAASLLGCDARESSKAFIEEVSGKLHEKLVRGAEHGHVPILCVRSGAYGSFTIMSGGVGFWTPAYHQKEEEVVDVTGAGNAWLGGFVAGLARIDAKSEEPWSKDDVERASLMGSVSASYTIEQRGLPTIAYDHLCPEIERWNGDLPSDRFQRISCRRFSS